MNPIEYNEVIAGNLRGTEPINWDDAKKAFKIGGFSPEKLKIKPRLEMLQRLCGGPNGDPVPVEKLAANSEQLREGNNAQKLLRLVARQYVQLLNKNARLPKFSKWVTSLFKDDKDLHNELAKFGQGVMRPDAPFIISCNPVDIMRCADTPHYYSCLTDTGVFKDVVPAALEKCDGIAIAYVNGPDGKMKGRIWLHAGEKDGKPIVVLASGLYGNGFTARQLAEHIAAFGYDVYQDTYYGGVTKFDYVGCFTYNLHWDTRTWNKGEGVRLAVAK